jgi:hypothetical protein
MFIYIRVKDGTISQYNLSVTTLSRIIMCDYNYEVSYDHTTGLEIMTVQWPDMMTSQVY